MDAALAAYSCGHSRGVSPRFPLGPRLRGTAFMGAYCDDWRRGARSRHAHDPPRHRRPPRHPGARPAAGGRTFDVEGSGGGGVAGTPEGDDPGAGWLRHPPHRIGHQVRQTRHRRGPALDRLRICFSVEGLRRAAAGGDALAGDDGRAAGGAHRGGGHPGRAAGDHRSQPGDRDLGPLRQPGDRRQELHLRRAGGQRRRLRARRR